MVFARQLRAAIKAGEITQTVRIWQKLHVKVGGHYRLDEGWVIVNSIWDITLEDITNKLSRECGFSSAADMLKTARHGPGQNIYLIGFEYVTDI